MSPGVCAVVLAAGRGARMRAGGVGTPKHLIEVLAHGTRAPMLMHVVRALESARSARTVVVLGPGDHVGVQALAGSDAEIRFADPPEEGRSASIRTGVHAAPEAGGWLFALADQPFLRATDFDRLIDALGDASTPQADGWGRIVHARYAGERGSPTLFGPGHREALLALRGKQGGREILSAKPACAVGVDLDPARGRDLDTPDDLSKSG